MNQGTPLHIPQLILLSVDLLALLEMQDVPLHYPLLDAVTFEVFSEGLVWGIPDSEEGLEINTTGVSRLGNSRVLEQQGRIADLLSVIACERQRLHLARFACS